MSRKLLVFLLSELSTTRILCRGCKVALELSLAELTQRRLTACPLCNADFDPLQTGIGPLAEFAKAARALQDMAKILDVAFILQDPGPTP